MKKEKGFTLVEIIVVIAILIVIAGIFSINMISSLNKNKEEENKNVVTQIRSAAEAYVSTNPEEVKKLYEGYGYVDIPVGDLRDAGLLSEDLKDAETGKKIPDEELVRVSLQTGDFVAAKYPLTNEEKNEKAYTLFAEDLNVEYDEDVTTSSWCGNNSNIYAGLYDRKKYNEATYASVVSKLYLMDNAYETKGEMYAGDHLAAPVNLKMTSCNVNPQVAGTYTINYKFTDPKQENEKVASRKVYVRTSNSDVISFTAVINNRRKINLNAVNVPITIIEKFKDGTPNNITTTIERLNNVGYTIENFYTTSIGTRTAVVSSKKTNSDGSTPKPADALYTVTDSFLDIVLDMPTVCTGSRTSCYFRGEQTNNYVEYHDTIYRVYNKTGDYIKLIYAGSDIIAPYGQLGRCTNNTCCNSGRWWYNNIGNEGYIGEGIVTTMTQTLENFYISKNVKGSSLQSQATPYGTKKISLLSKAEYEEISRGYSTNYLVGTDFWLVDSAGYYSGAVAYNKGSLATNSLDYAVNSSGVVYIAGARKNSTFGGDYSTANIHTDKLAVRPTIQIQNPKFLGGSGTASDPYVIE